MIDRDKLKTALYMRQVEHDNEQHIAWHDVW